MQREDLLGGDCDELTMLPVRLLAEDRDERAMLDSRVDHDSIADGEPFHVFAQARDDPRAVGSENVRLGSGGQTIANPDIEMVQRRCPQLDQNLAGTSCGIGHILVRRT